MVFLCLVSFCFICYILMFMETIYSSLRTNSWRTFSYFYSNYSTEMNLSSLSLENWGSRGRSKRGVIIYSFSPFAWGDSKAFYLSASSSCILISSFFILFYWSSSSPSSKFMSSSLFYSVWRTSSTSVFSAFYLDSMSSYYLPSRGFYCSMVSLSLSSAACLALFSFCSALFYADSAFCLFYFISWAILSETELVIYSVCIFTSFNSTSLISASLCNRMFYASRLTITINSPSFFSTSDSSCFCSWRESTRSSFLSAA